MFERKGNGNIQKGRFAQALAEQISKENDFEVPEYLKKLFNTSVRSGQALKLSKEQIDIIDAPLGPIAITACAGSGKTATAIRRLIAIRQKMQNSRGHVVLLSFSNVAVNTFNAGYAELAAGLPDDANRRRVEVDTLDGFYQTCFTSPCLQDYDRTSVCILGVRFGAFSCQV